LYQFIEIRSIKIIQFNERFTHMPDEQILNITRDYIYLLNQEGFRIIRAFLYGSYAKGNMHDSSDIDLMLVSDYQIEDDMQKKMQAWLLTRKIDTRIEPYLVNNHRFVQDEDSPLVEIVKNEGLEIMF